MEKGKFGGKKKGLWLPVPSEFFIDRYEVCQPVDVKKILQELRDLPTPFAYAEDPVAEWKRICRGEQ